MYPNRVNESLIIEWLINLGLASLHFKSGACGFVDIINPPVYTASKIKANVEKVSPTEVTISLLMYALIADNLMSS